MDRRITLVGITGGIGAGKTAVSQHLIHQGFTVINADDLAKNIIANDENIKQNLIKEFGKKSYTNGKYNAEYIADIVFDGENSPASLEKLNQLVHPAVIQKIMDCIENLENQKIKLIFIEIALLFEMNLERGFDYIITVCAKDDIRYKRLMERSAFLNKNRITNIMKSQISQEEKIKNSDFIIDNNKNINDLHKAIDFLIPIIEKL